MNFRVDVTFCWDQPIQAALKIIRSHRGKIIDFVPSGPSGGNPLLLLEFSRRSDALALVEEMSPAGEDPKFMDGRIEVVT